MKLYLIQVCIFFLLVSCNNKKKTTNAITNKQDSLGKLYGILVSSSDIENKCFEYTENGIKFSKCIDEDSCVIYRQSDDSDFRTEEGIYVGMHFNKVKNITKKQLIKEYGWSYYFPLKSDWNASFLLDEKTDYKTLKDSTVAFIFKREKHKKTFKNCSTKEKI